jgi:site-specific DNA-adenine methylase
VTRNLRAINYFGSKVSSAHHYPAPLHRTIVEPFAGGAGYSLLHYTHDVILLDKSQDVIGAWQYLIQTDPADVLKLPLIASGQEVSSLECSPGARLFISWCLNQTATPRRTLSSWGEYHNARGAACYWGAARREQAAMIAGRIKHWRAYCASYAEAPSIEATWFVDPPYVDGGKAYPFHAIDYQYLSLWCQEREGQIIVCERSGADWLPFEAVCSGPTQKRYLQGARTRCSDAMWYREAAP